MTAIQTTELCITSVSAAEAPQITYQIQATLEREPNVIATETNQAGRFVLATNVLDVNELSNDQMLSKYKEQQSAERGFGFLKDPLFFTDSVFLKSPERIEALALCFWVCVCSFIRSPNVNSVKLYSSRNLGLRIN